MANHTTSSDQYDIVRVDQDRRRERLGSQLVQLDITHQRFCPAELPHPGWNSYAAQRHARDIDVDLKRGWMWMATWGGVLCWAPDAGLCTRYTSEHGLIGNATRSLAVDQSGVVWVGGQNGGLCSLTLDDGAAWRPHDDFWSWTVLRLVPRPDGGIYAALRDPDGRCALGEVTTPDARLRLLAQGGLATKEIETLLVDQDGTLWVGNTWGLHRYLGNGMPHAFESLDLQREPVRALAIGIGRGLWVGTTRGVYRFHPGEAPPHTREDDWPRDEVVSLTLEPTTGSLWVATAREVGRIVNNVWQPVRRSPPGRLNELLSANPDLKTRLNIPTLLFREDRTWAGGANGLYEIAVDECKAAFVLTPEEKLSNAVQSLWVDEAAVWVGTARGLHHFDGQAWHSYDDAPALSDVRAIMPGRTNGRLWIGSWRSGLCRLQSGVYVPDQPLAVPIAAMAAGADGTMWAATLDQVYWRLPESSNWELVDPPARTRIRGPIIQTICAVGGALWVGTSAGLFCYNPGSGLWDREELKALSIQALALDPLTGHLWVGTPAGLYGLYNEHTGKCHREVDVRALAFSPAPAGTLWVGTAAGLERWPAPGEGEVFAAKPEKRFTAANSGLAADIVTALAVRAVGDKEEVWIGSPAGVSCYRYPP